MPISTNFFFLEKNNFFFLEKFFSMEDLITHFKYYSENFIIPEGITYTQIESPKGYLGVFLISDNSKFIYRIRLRSPVAYNMNAIPAICSGLSFADFISTFCSLDIVLGEIDR
jgi:NADH-quinone oxidoreductase subunit D